MDKSIKIFERIARIPIAPLNTPLERCDRLQQAVTGMPEIYVKHDDYIGSLVWGNKVRKLEYCYAEAQHLGADTIITCGGSPCYQEGSIVPWLLRQGYIQLKQRLNNFWPVQQPFRSFLPSIRMA